MRHDRICVSWQCDWCAKSFDYGCFEKWKPYPELPWGWYVTNQHKGLTHQKHYCSFACYDQAGHYPLGKILRKEDV